MNKLLTKIVGAALGLSMTVGVGVAVASNANKGLKPASATVGGNVVIGSKTYESVYETGFENATASSTYNNTKSYNTTEGDGTSWTMYYGTVSTNSALNGSKSAQMRWYSSAKTNYPYIATTSANANIKAIKFDYKVGNANVDFKVQKSSDGSTWTDIETVNTSGTEKTTYSKEFSSAESMFYLKILVCLGTAPSSGNYTFHVDDIVFGKEKAASDPTVSIEDPSISNLPKGYVASTQLQATASDFANTVTYTWTATSNSSYVTLTQDPSDGSKCIVSSKGTNDTGNVTIQVSATDGSTTKTATKTISLVSVNTVTQSIAAISSGTGTQGVYTKGIVNGYYKTSAGFVTDINEAADITGSGQAKFFISADGSAGDASSRIEAFNCLDLNKAAFTSYPMLGTEVVVYGNLTLYQTTYEIEANCFLVYKASPTVSSIAKTTDLTTDTYTVGETFSLDGLVVTATLSTGATMDVTSLCTFLPDDGDVLSEELDELIVSYSASNNPTTTLGTDLEISITISVSYPSPSETIAAINAIGTVAYTQACWDLISAARLLYDNLPSQSQANVTNYSTLTDAEDDFEDLMIAAVSNVETLISAIGTVTLSSGTAISNAETAYAALLAENLGKGQVSNYATLTAARTAYDALVADRAAADAVEDLIDALPAAADITDYSHHADIVAARAAYNALTAERKALVDSTKLVKLEACEAKDATFAPLEIDYDFASGDESGSHNLTKNSDAVASFETFKGSAGSTPAWNNSQLKVYGGGYLRITVKQGFIITSVKLTFASNAGGKQNVIPDAMYYAGNPGTDYASESFTSTLTSNVAVDNLSLTEGQEFAVFSDGSAGNLGYTNVYITYEREIVTQTELRVSTSTLTVGLNNTNTFDVTYYNTTSDFTITSADSNKVSVTFTSAHGEEGVVTVTVNGLALTNSAVRLTISATGASDVYVDVSVKDIEQFKRITTIDKLVNNSEIIFSDGSSISSSFDTSHERYTMTPLSPTNDIYLPEENYLKFKINIDEKGYTIFDMTNELYLTLGSENGKIGRTDDPSGDSAHWTISINNGNFQIDNVATPGSYLRKNSGNPYFAMYSTQSNMRIYLKNADSVTTAQSLDAFGRLYLNSISNPVTTTPTGVDTGVCRTSGSYLKAKAALAGDWSVISSALQADQTGYGLRYTSWAIANNDGAPFDGNTTVVTPLQSSNSFNFVSDKSTNAAAIIAIVSVISLSAVAGFFLLRKRKEQ